VVRVLHTARCSACEGHSPRRSVRGHVLQWRLGTSAGRIDAPVEGVAVWPRAHAASGAPRSPASIYTIQPPASACHLTFGQYSTPVDLLSALPFLFGLAVVPSPQSPRHGGRLGAMEFFFNRLPVAIVPPPPPPSPRRFLGPPADAHFPLSPRRQYQPADGHVFLSGSHVTSPPVSTTRPSERPFLQGGTAWTPRAHETPARYHAAAQPAATVGVNALHQQLPRASTASPTPFSIPPVANTHARASAGSSGSGLFGVEGNVATYPCAAAARGGGYVASHTPAYLPPSQAQRGGSPLGHRGGSSDDETLPQAWRRPGASRPPPGELSSRAAGGRRGRLTPIRASPSPLPTRQRR